MRTKLALLVFTLMFCNSPAFSADDESGPQMLDARLSSRGPFQIGDRFTITLVMQDVGASGVRNVQFQLKDKFGRQHSAENDDKLSYFSTPSFLCSDASICEYPFVFKIDETWANNGFITLSNIRAFDMKTNGTYFYVDGSIEDLQTRKKSSNQHALSGLSLQLGNPPPIPTPTPTPIPTPTPTPIDLNPIADAASAAVDTALAAADASDASTASAEEAIVAASSLGTDLVTISKQIEKLDIAIKNATASLAIVTNALDNTRSKVTKSMASLSAPGNAIGKQALAAAVSRLANAVTILGSSKSKLSGKVIDLEARKSSLLDAQKQLIGKLDDGKTSKPSSAKPVAKEKVIVCKKAKSTLKVIGKNPVCPAGYKVKK